MPEYHKDDISQAYGVCSDYIKITNNENSNNVNWIG